MKIKYITALLYTADSTNAGADSADIDASSLIE
jgi:hypothetical protein